MPHRQWFHRVTYDLTRFAARLAAISLLRFRCGGRAFFPSEGGAIVCCNHQSFFDPVIVGLVCDRRLNYLARENLFHSRAFGALIRWYDAIPIQRDGLGLSGLKETLRRLKRGEFVLVFPEGTRTRDGQVQPLKSGICVLARRARVPLVPVAIDGAFSVWPRHRKIPVPGPICAQVGEPILPGDFEALSDEQLVALLDRRIRSCHQEARRLLSTRPIRR